MHPRDLYLRHTSEVGKSYVAEHRVWDAERFIASQKRAAAALNAEHLKKTKADGKAGVEQITRDQYLKERTK